MFQKYCKFILMFKNIPQMVSKFQKLLLITMIHNLKSSIFEIFWVVRISQKKNCLMLTLTSALKSCEYTYFLSYFKTFNSEKRTQLSVVKF